MSQSAEPLSRSVPHGWGCLLSTVNIQGGLCAVKEREPLKLQCGAKAECWAVVGPQSSDMYFNSIKAVLSHFLRSCNRHRKFLAVNNL